MRVLPNQVTEGDVGKCNHSEELLTPSEINRIRDLIHLGPLSVDVSVDSNLVELGFAKPYMTPISRSACVDEREYKEELLAAQKKMLNIAKRCKEIAAANKKAIAAKKPHQVQLLDGGDFLMEARREAKRLFYNEQGGVKGRWWKASGLSFSEYMRTTEQSHV